MKCKGVQNKMTFEKDKANFTEIEQEIVNRLCLDLSPKTNKWSNEESIAKKKENSESIIELCQLLKDRYRTRASVEYLFYLVRYHNGLNYRTAQSVVNRFLQALDISYKDLDVCNASKTYHKLVMHRIQDISREQSEEDIEVYSGVSFRNSESHKVIHLLLEGF